MIVEAKRIPLDERHARLTPFPQEAGSFRFEDMGYHAAEPPVPGELGRFSYGCPRGTGHCGAVIICNGPKPPHSKQWGWDGNVERPTLTPSINCLSHGPDGEKYAGCGWHGFITNGQFKD
jgi:hypothetical protein